MQLPFPGRNDDEKEARILRGTISFTGSKAWTDISREGKNFVQALLEPKEQKRLTGTKVPAAQRRPSSHTALPWPPALLA